VPHDNDSAYGTASQSVVTEDHAELDILDSLGLSDEPAPVKLRHLFLDKSTDSDESVSLLTGHINGRLEEGHGECLFDLGLEDNGDNMGFSMDDWDFALKRVELALHGLGADYKMLLTRNVGGNVEVEGLSAKDTAVSGKMIIRRRPGSVDDVIETRIAVVGNGECGRRSFRDKR